LPDIIHRLVFHAMAIAQPETINLTVVSLGGDVILRNVEFAPTDSTCHLRRQVKASMKRPLKLVAEDLSSGVTTRRLGRCGNSATNFHCLLHHGAEHRA
jgi:hypothetical protein